MYHTSHLPILFQRLWLHLSRRRQLQFVLMLLLMLVSAFSEIVSLGAVLPFLAVLAAPEKAVQNPIVGHIFSSMGIALPNDLLLPLTIAFAAAALIASAIRMLLVWAGLRLGLASGTDLSIDLYRRTLYQPYQVHAARNSSEVIAGITHKINSVVFGVLQPVLTLLSSSVILIALITVMILIDPVVALTAALGFGISYALIAKFVSHRLKVNSEQVSRAEKLTIKALQEGLGGIRDVLLNGVQLLYTEIYREAEQPLRRAQGDSQFISLSPRYAMEALGMTLIAALAYVMSLRSGGMEEALPVLGALALGAQRLLPTMQQAYGAWVSIASCKASLVETLDMLDQALPPEVRQPVQAPLVFSECIIFDKVRFRYTEETNWVLNGIDLMIPSGARVGFVGSTGSGKSTTLDLLMGLLQPVEGSLSVDGITIDANSMRAWQQTIAHVPQSIYLADTTLAENIAFGVPKNNIDLARVRLAAQQAQIAEFIEGRPGAYDAFVGERGIRLSGGQRQRIGIARALYKQASILIFDEATSALDNVTEQFVMEAINGLDHEFTVIIVAHRLSTVKNCDMIAVFEQGKVVAQGSYDELLEKSHHFRRMVDART